MRLTQAFRGILLLGILLITSCGGGGGGGGGPTPPSGLSYSTPPAFMVGQVIASLTPTVTGQVTSYSVDQTLPAGLSLNTTSGVISGTPTTATARANYTVHAQNSAGSTSTTLALVVNAPPVLGYSSTTYTYTANVPAQAIAPKVNSGLGSNVTWSVSPALPTGLSLDADTGTISGTPTSASPAGGYSVTAAYSGGTITATLTISVAAAPVLDLGHAAPPVVIRTNSSRVLSADATGHWLLQDFTSGNTIATGDGACVYPCGQVSPGVLTQVPVDMAGGVMMDNSPTGLEIRSWSDGHVITKIPDSNVSWFSLASDGSYVAIGTSTALTTWSSTTGQTVFSRQGDYSKAAAVALPAAILVAKGPAGQNVIETVTVPTGASSSGPAFQGTFHTWFGDGSHFITTLSNALWIYTNASVQEEIQQLTSGFGQLGGVGQWFWIDAAVYEIGGGTSPAIYLHRTPFVSGTTLGAMTADGSGFLVVDLSGTTPAAATYTLPAAFASAVRAFGALSATGFVLGNDSGAIVDGSSLTTQPRYLTLGGVRSIAGGTKYFAVATELGQILYFDAGTKAQLGTIPLRATMLSASSDGSVLVGLGIPQFTNAAGSTSVVNVYSLPSATVIGSFTAPTPGRVRVSGSGTVLALIGAGTGTSSPPCLVQVGPITGGTPILCDNTQGAGDAYLSPDGTLVAERIGGVSVVSPGVGAGATTSIFQNGTLLTAVPSLPLGWLDDGHLLAQLYDSAQPQANYLSSAIYAPQGNVLSTPPLPVFPIGPYPAYPVSSYGSQWILNTRTPLSTVYANGLNQIVSLTTGATTWASADQSLGQAALTGTDVIFNSGAFVLAQPY